MRAAIAGGLGRVPQTYDCAAYGNLIAPHGGTEPGLLSFPRRTPRRSSCGRAPDLSRLAQGLAGPEHRLSKGGLGL